MAKSTSVNAPIQILFPTKTSSDTFHHPGGVGVFIALRGHAGGVWSLFAQYPDGTWVDVGEGDVEFKENAIRLFDAPATLSYQLRSGSAGAVAWLLSNEKYP